MAVSNNRSCCATFCPCWACDQQARCGWRDLPLFALRSPDKHRDNLENRSDHLIFACLTKAGFEYTPYGRLTNFITSN